jgi:hypothetical protein
MIPSPTQYNVKDLCGMVQGDDVGISKFAQLLHKETPDYAEFQVIYFVK